MATAKKFPYFRWGMEDQRKDAKFYFLARVFRIIYEPQEVCEAGRGTAVLSMVCLSVTNKTVYPYYFPLTFNIL